VSQSFRPPESVTGIALLFTAFNILMNEILVYLLRFQIFELCHVFIFRGSNFDSGSVWV
jgi:hypothetical protein